VTTDRLEEGIYRLRLDDPEQGNRLTAALCADLLEALADLAVKSDLRVLLLQGTRAVFCAGASREALERISTGAFEVRELELPARVLGFPVPVVAALEGHAVGGGLILALCADVVVASESSRYGVNFTDLDFTPGMGATALLPALAGHGFAAEMMLTAKLYKGRELAGRGLFQHVVAPRQVEPVALEIARRIAEKPKHVVELVKETLAAPRLRALEAALDREQKMHRDCFSRPGIAASIRDKYWD
jgi:polyketide biosynthesis enoyl-CoA hydratase PksI